MNIVFQDRTFSFELLRTLGFTAYGGADIGECLTTAARIPEGDFDAWYREWTATAERIEAQARESLARGHRVSARGAFLRASSYHRTAEFFLHGTPSDPRILAASRTSAACFAEAAKLMDIPPERIDVPYEGTTLPALFYKAEASDRPRPTLIMTGGFDSVLEEFYFEGGAAALERGYNVLAFDGPGQGMPLREQGLVFRPDWEAVVTPVVDYALSRPDVDPERLALMGMSQGGYLAPRAAAFEPRVKALIAYDGVWSLLDAALGGFGSLGERRALVLEQIMAPEAPVFDLMLDLAAKRTIGARWMFENGLWTFGARTKREMLAKAVAYTLEGVAPRIACPTLVCEAERDLFFIGQPRRLFDALTCPKTFIAFTEAEGAGEHCQEGALTLFAARAFDWLDETFTAASAPVRSAPAARAA